MRSVTVRTDGTGPRQQITVGPNTFTADLPADAGGTDQGPEPHELLLSALGTCTSMTLGIYAKRKQMPLESVDVELEGRKEESGYVIERRITLHGALSEDQRAMLLSIADRCPVAKTLSGSIRIDSSATLAG